MATRWQSGALRWQSEERAGQGDEQNWLSRNGVHMSLNLAMMSSERDNWETPMWLYQPYVMQYSLDLDVAASCHNKVCARYYDGAYHGDGLKDPWDAPVWCNPPYGANVDRWTERASVAGKRVVVVMLLAARTDTRWFHDHVYATAAEIVLLKGRVRFLVNGTPAPQTAPFPSMVCIWKPGFRFVRGPRVTTMQALSTRNAK